MKPAACLSGADLGCVPQLLWLENDPGKFCRGGCPVQEVACEGAGQLVWSEPGKGGLYLKSL